MRPLMWTTTALTELTALSAAAQLFPQQLCVSRHCNYRHREGKPSTLCTTGPSQRVMYKKAAGSAARAAKRTAAVHSRTLLPAQLRGDNNSHCSDQQHSVDAAIVLRVVGDLQHTVPKHTAAPCQRTAHSLPSRPGTPLHAWMLQHTHHTAPHTAQPLRPHRLPSPSPAHTCPTPPCRQV